MEKHRIRCKAKTKSGESYPFKAQFKSNFCGHHLDDNQKIKIFFNKHKKKILPFLAGSVGSPLLQDIFDYTKDKLGVKYFIPYVTIEANNDYEKSWIHNKDIQSLIKLLPLLDINQSESSVKKLFGNPNRIKSHNKNLLEQYQHHFYSIKPIGKLEAVSELHI